MSSISYRYADISDALALTNLMNSHYIRQKKESYFLWQLSPNPFDTRFVLATSGDQIAGMLGVQSRSMEDGRIGLQLIDMLVSQEYRGLGVFSEMIEYYLATSEKADFLYVLPNLHGMRAVTKLGWRLVGKIEEMITTRDTFACYHCDEDDSGYAPSIVPSLLPNMENWRFQVHPEHNYFYKTIDEKNYAVLKIFNDHITGTRYGDIVYLREHGKLRDVYRSSVELLFEIGVDQVSTWALPLTGRYSLALELGFYPEDRERYLCVKPINNKMNDIEAFCNWSLNQADAEMY